MPSAQLEHLKAALAERYRIDGEVGSGGMATVYRAEDLKHHRQVAIKVLKPELDAVLGSERFLREIEIAAGLSHPHILPLLDSGRVTEDAGARRSGSVYYVMPYVEGESLRDRLGREKQLPVDEALRISREVADALSYAHSRGVIHRDIKPENILLQSGHAVVADFGIARAIDRAGGETLTETGLALGTPAYMSPEQAAGSRDLDGRSDLYSLGCVLYEMLAGQPPFTGPTIARVVHQHLAVEPPNITVIRPAVSAQVAAALQRALAKTPADRFNPVALFAEALGPSGMAGVTAAPPDLVRAVRRRWSNGHVVALGLAAVVMVIGAVLLGRHAKRSPAPAPATDRVVVLPYSNRTGDPALDHVGHMVAEWITEGLMRTGAVQVVPNVMALEAMHQARDAGGGLVLDRVATGTQSRIVVMGSYYRQGGALEFHSEVVDMRSGTPFATITPIRGSTDDPRGAVDSVRIQVMGALATRLSPLVGWELPPAAQPPTYEASQAHARGIEEWTRADYAAAAQSFERAYALDTTYLRALMLASGAHGNAGHRERGDSLYGILLVRRHELAPYDRYRLDYVAALRRDDRAAALAAIRAAVELVPFGTARFALIGSLRALNRPHEALRSIEEIHAQFVEIGGAWHAAWRLYTELLHELGEHERELELARESRTHVSGPLFGMAYEGCALAALGRLDELTTLVGEMALAASQPVLTPGDALASIGEEARAHGHRVAALEIAERGLRWYDGQPEEFQKTGRARSLRARLLYLHEDWDGAAAVLTADSAHVVDALGYQGAAAARRGDPESARRFAKALADLRLPPMRGGATRWRARIAALLGERDEAVALLQRAFSEGLDYGIWLHRDADLESLAGFPPFEELVRPRG
jgi:TolB-like protein/tetratricopeptide (TPR) repeat protein